MKKILVIGLLIFALYYFRNDIIDLYNNAISPKIELQEITGVVSDKILSPIGAIGVAYQIKVLDTYYNIDSTIWDEIDIGDLVTIYFRFDQVEKVLIR